MHRVRTWLAAGMTLALLAASGPVFAQGASGRLQGGAPGASGGGPAQVEPSHPGPQGSHAGPLPGRHGTYRANGGHGNLGPVPGGRRGVPLPPLRRYVPAPPATCFALTMVSGTVSRVYAGGLSVVESGGRTLTLPLAANAVVTEGGVPVPPAALAVGQAVTVTVGCRGLAIAVSIGG